MNIFRRCTILTLYILGILLVPHGYQGQATVAAQGLSTADWQTIQGLLPLNEQALLRASNADMNDLFGIGVAIDGNTVVVGAEGNKLTNDSYTNVGAVYVFERDQNDPTMWTEQAILRASNGEGGDSFGSTVAIEGDTIVVGAWRESGPQNTMQTAGAVYVFERDQNDPTLWTEQAILRPANAAAGDRFGSSIAIDGNTIAVGTYNHPGPRTGESMVGAAYIFVKDGTTWTEQAFLQPASLADRDRFGVSVDIAGDTLVVGAFGTKNPENNTELFGAAYIFERNGTTWTEPTILRPESNSWFGESVSIDGDTIAIGAPGLNQVYVFVWNGSAWVRQTLLEDVGGSKVIVQGDLLLSTQYWQNSVYLFERNDTDWIQQAVLQGSDTQADDQFGSSLGLDGTSIIIGASHASGPEVEMGLAGAAYIFEQAITVDADVDRFVSPNELVTLQGNANSNSAMSYEWTQLSGTAVTLTNALSLTATFTAPTETNALRFQLTVTNTYGLTATDTVTIRIATDSVYLPMVRHPRQ